MDLNLKQTKLTAVGGIVIPDVFDRRILSGISKMDILFGGIANPGVLPGSSFTITARWGCGKSTLMMQWMQRLSEAGYNVAIVSGEEDIHQMAYTARRLNVKDVQVANMTDIDQVAALTEHLDVLVIDSFQAMKPNEKKHGKMNSRKVEKYCVETITNAGKRNECVIGFIMHLTKGGQMKGGSNIPHIVDANFTIKAPDMDDSARVVECDGKNRFGPPGEFTAAMGPMGYDFEVDIDLDELLGEASEGKSHSKGSRDQKLIKKMQTYTADEPITFAVATQFLGCEVMVARHILSCMNVSGLVVKKGRGNNATFELVKKEEVVEVDADKAPSTEA